MLSPPPKLEIDELPHHKGLSHADGGQHTDPRDRRQAQLHQDLRLHIQRGVEHHLNWFVHHRLLFMRVPQVSNTFSSQEFLKV